jgi:lipopolysaccharide transport system permease protein
MISFQQLKQYADVVRYKVRADLKSDGIKTYFGILWWILDPILFMLVFYVIFSLIRMRTEDFVPFLLIGLVMWQWWNNALNNGANSIVQAKGLIKQVYLPKELFPLVSIFTDTFKFAIVFGLLLVFLWIYGSTPTTLYIWLPFLLLCQFLLILGGAFIVAGIIPFVPDLRFAIQHTLRMMFFMSGIFFPASRIPEQYLQIYYLNPMANLIEAFRDVLLYHREPSPERLIMIAVTSFAVFLVGWAVIRRFDRTYPKVIN